MAKRISTIRKKRNRDLKKTQDENNPSKMNRRRSRRHKLRRANLAS